MDCAEDFIDLLAISQSAPGILAVNISIFIGYKLRGIRGSIITALGTILPSHTHTSLYWRLLYFSIVSKTTLSVERIFKGDSTGCCGTYCRPDFHMAKSAKINRHNLWIPVVSALLIWLLGFSPIWIIIAAGSAEASSGENFRKLKVRKVRMLIIENYRSLFIIQDSW